MTVTDEEREQNFERVREHGILGDRSCTDCPCILVAGVFVIGWIIILSVAVSLGKPARILQPSNFRGDLCGDDPLAEHPNLWIPRASRLSYGLCVKRCPRVGDVVCSNDISTKYASNSTPAEEVPNHFYTHTVDEQDTGRRASLTCLFSPGECTGLVQLRAERYEGMIVRQRDYRCFTNWYSSGATIFRCLPFQDENDNKTLASLVGDSAEALSDLAEFVGVGSFFNRGFGEVEQSWLVILLSGLTCCVVSMIWIFLLRWIMKPLVYLCILLILALLILIGYLAMLMADDLENVKLPGDTATDDQIKLWRALQYGAWILAAMYIIVMAYLIKRIKIAIAIMREASLVFLESPGLIVVPPVVFLLFVAWVVFFIVTTIYIQTIGELEDGAFEAAARDTFGDTVVNFTLSAVNTTENALADNNITNQTINTTEWTQDEKIKIMHAYNFFGFLWASTFCIMYGFFIIAMTGTVYYYSATQGQMALADEGKEEEEGAKTKETGYFTIPLSFLAGLRYHLGTILFGSLLIAIIQFVRALFLYFKEQFLEEWSESATVACAIKCIEYCLWYIQKVVEIISKNAFIICCILNTSFCSSAGTAMSIIGANGARVGVLSMLAAVACFVLKVFIVGTNMVLAWLFINTESLTQDKPVESGLFPMFGILIMSFIIASVFVNVYEALVDTTLMSFLIDEEHFGGKFMPEELAELTDMFKGAEEARREYERKLREASDRPEARKEEAKSKQAA